MGEQVVSTKTEYKIYECLGAGLNGEVYRGIRQDCGGLIQQEVAIKILKSETAVEIWKREFESLQAVHSPFCARVFAFERIDGNPALILEYIRGCNLSELLSWCRVSPKEFEEITKQVVHGLRDLREMGLAHGDMSPNNVMLDGEGRVRLVDFGRANTELGFSTFTYQDLSQRDFLSLQDIMQKLWVQLYYNVNYPPWMQDISHWELGKPDFINDGARAYRKALGRRVKLFLAAKAKLRWRTNIQTRGGLGRHWQWLLRSVVMALFIPLASATTRLDVQPWAMVEVRTTRWHQVWLNDADLGFTPIEKQAVAPGKYQLRWQSTIGRGQRSLTLQPGNHILIREEDLKPQP